MSNVIIVANKVSLNRIVDRILLETMFFLRISIIHSECPSLLDYAEGVAKAGIGLMNVGQQGTDKIALCHWETL